MPISVKVGGRNGPCGSASGITHWRTKTPIAITQQYVNRSGRTWRCDIGYCKISDPVAVEVPHGEADDAEAVRKRHRSKCSVTIAQEYTDIRSVSHHKIGLPVPIEVANRDHIHRKSDKGGSCCAEVACPIAEQDYKSVMVAGNQIELSVQVEVGHGEGMRAVSAREVEF